MLIVRNRLDFIGPGARAGQVRELRDGGTVILEGHPFAYRVRVAEIDGQPRVIGLDIRSPDGQPTALTPNDLRRIPLDRLAHAAASLLTGDVLARLTEPGPSGFRHPEPAENAPSNRPGRRGHTPEFYARIAELWHAAQDPTRNVRGLSIHRYISAEMTPTIGRRVSENAVKSWLRRTRELGLLTADDRARGGR